MKKLRLGDWKLGAKRSTANPGAGGLFAWRTGSLLVGGDASVSASKNSRAEKFAANKTCRERGDIPASRKFALIVCAFFQSLLTR
ncbi:MAG TPA: hypothetical protein VHW03_00220 [Chthoniobacterales bacterium]|nr:hypothetical protein [Chthoniobacterales bacterium]